MGKNRTQMRSDLRLDLKDSATTWSNGELDRCIERAVGDLSRFLPDEKLYEESLQFTVTGKTVTFPADTSATAIVNASSLAAVIAGDFIAAAAQPDVPRPITWTLTDANNSIVILSIIVSGTDRNGDSIVERFHYGFGGVKTGIGSLYFKYVHSIEIDQFAYAASAGGDTLSIGYGAYTDVWVWLANKPIKKDSETVTDHARDAAYVMDYANGRIKAISAGGISAGDSDTIGYTKSKISLDLSSLPGFIRLRDVEYPCGEIPQEHASYEVFGNVVTVTSMQSTSQHEMDEDKHIAMRYYARHYPPTDKAPGSYPDFLDSTVELAASAYALFMIATKYEHQMATDLSTGEGKISSAESSIGDAESSIERAKSSLGDERNSAAEVTNSLVAGAAIISVATSELALTTDIHTLVDAAFNKIDGKVAAVVSALGDAATQASGATSALVKVATYLEDNSNQDAKHWLTEITSDAAELRTKITVALGGAASHLAHLATATNGDFALAEAVWAEEVKHILSDAAVTVPNAEDLLEAGDDKIDLVNIGADVAELNRRYAETALNMAEKWAAKRRDYLTGMARRIDAAMAFTTEASQRLYNLRSYMEQAEGWGNIAKIFVEEATQRVATCHAFLGKADGFIAICRAFTEEGMARIAEIRTHIEEAAVYQGLAGVHVDSAAVYQAVASTHGNAAAVYQGVAAIHRDLATAYHNEVALYQAQADTHGELAEKFREEAIERRNEAWAIWRDPKQYIGQFSLSSRRQAYGSTTT